MATVNKHTKNSVPRHPFFRLIIFLFKAGILLAVLAMGINLFVMARSKQYILTAEQAEELENADCILVLGCLVRSNGSMSGMLKDRVDTGISLYQSGVSDRLLMSGDHGRKNYDEVNTMKAYAISEGIPSDHIFMDHAGFSTYESMYRARDIFKAKKVIIVTQRYHLYRAVYAARSLGLEAYGVPADLHSYGGQMYREIREILARDKDFLYCLFKPKPTYLGEAIPVSGNGDATND